MTCNPQIFFEASRQIQKIAADEGGYRAAANRAYYAAYHCCRLYYAGLPHLSVLAGKGRHEQLINALTIPSKKLTTNSQARSAALGKYLRDLCDARVHADYYPDDPFSADKMNDALDTAEIIFACAAVAKGPVQAQVSPLSQV